ncbi:MAG: hypothetical protein KF723_22105 [Rhizobiaceae bacterium]|nr:hypothetical protein [Rhizobiaceae bacterium]
MNQHFLEKVQPAPGFVPVNMATGANTGKRFDMKNHGRCAVIFFKGAGNSAEDPTITLLQHNAADGGTSKALNFTRVDRKQGTLTSVAEFTTTNPDAGNTYTNSTLSEAAIVVIDIKAEDLDIDGGFQWISANVADVGTNAQVGCVLYCPHEPRYGGGQMNQHFCEKFQIVAGFAPVDMAASSGPVSDVVSMKNYGRCAAVLFAGVGTSNNDTTVTAKQSALVAGSPANLNFNRIDVKQAVDIDDAPTFTQIANADHDYTSDTSGESQLIWVVDIKAEDLDEGKDSFALTVNDHGAAKLGGLLYFLHEPRYSKATMPGAIAD